MRWKQFLTPVKSMDTEEAKAYMAEHEEGSFTLLDVRQPGEYENSRIPGATLIPLPELADRLGELDPDKPIIPYWAMGGRSRAAAQLLAGKGFKEIYNLKGGIKAWQGLTAEGPAEMGIIPLSGDETASDIIIIAYGMEHGLEEFYSAVSGMTSDPEVADVLTKLAKIEGNHKQRLLNLYRTLDPDVGDKETFEANISSDILEGGFTTEEFLEQNSAIMDTVTGVLNIAMMLETQALDLYLRYSQKALNEESKTVLYDIAEEEKAHLASLGRLMEVKA